ncbi:MAG: class I SAM-dependent methyltransferase [Candidatus Staskawiczbacteria bacterium]|nr:class I SAM-dependent methyltransferase [Candidatus Staskawiczbacteria bacterium]
MKINCPICNRESSFFVKKKDRFNQSYNYFKCMSCRFLFDEDIVKNKKVLEEKTSKVYDKEYFKNIDSGWKQRGDKMLSVINIFIKILSILKSNKNIEVLDYGAGNGYVTSKIKSANVFYYDKYEQPIYNGHYKALDRPEKVDIVCAVELVEHLSDINELTEISKLSGKALILTTEVSNGISDNELLDWVYVNPDAGHTCIYSFESLFLFAKKNNLFYFFFPYKFSHIFIKSKLLSRLNFVSVEYFVYKLIKKFKSII